MHKKIVLIGALALFCFGVPKIQAQETELVLNEENVVTEDVVTPVEENVIPETETPVVITPEEEVVTGEEEAVIVVNVDANEEGLNTEDNVDTTPGETDNAPVPDDTVVVVPLSAQAIVTSGVLAATAFMLI